MHMDFRRGGDEGGGGMESDVNEGGVTHTWVHWVWS